MPRRFLGRPVRASILVAVCSLGASIGALGAATTLLDGLVLNPVRVDEPERLMDVVGLARNIPGYQADEWWGQADAFSAIALYSMRDAPLEVDGARRHGAVALVSPRFFEVLRHQPTAGRLLSVQDAVARGASAAVVSEAFANAHLPGHQPAIGTAFAIAGMPHVIVGVVGRGAELPRLTDVWVLRTDALEERLTGASAVRPAWSGQSSGGIGRLAPSASVDKAQGQISALLERLTAEVTPRTRVHFGTRARVRPLRELLAREPTAAVSAFAGGSLLVLVLAALSCGLLVMNQHVAQQREWAMRQVLGATPAHVRRRLVGLAARWALLGGAVGMGCMSVLLRLLEYLGTSGVFIPRVTGTGTVYALVGTLAAVSVVVAVTVLPALASSRVPLVPVLNDQRRYALSAAPSWVMRGLVVAMQACAGFVIIVGAAFATRDLVRTLTFDNGVRPLRGTLVLPLRRGTGDAAGDARAWDLAWHAARDVPGVQTLAMMSEVPVRSSARGVWMEADGRRVFVARRFVRGSFERLLGMAGVDGVLGDVPGGLGLSRSAVSALALHSDAPGTARFDGDATMTWRVDAVLSDLHFQDAETTAESAAYLDLSQAVALRVRVPTMQVLFTCAATCTPDVVGRLTDAITPYADVDAPVQLTALYDLAARPTRARALVANVYAGIALLIVVAGIYTLSGAVVLGSAFESGMRLALGAGRRDIVFRLLARVCMPAVLGIAAGTAGVLMVKSRLTSAILSAPSGSDITGAAAILLMTAVIAALLPALFLVRQPLISLLRR